MYDDGLKLVIAAVAAAIALLFVGASWRNEADDLTTVTQCRRYWMASCGLLLTMAFISFMLWGGVDVKLELLWKYSNGRPTASWFPAALLALSLITITLVIPTYFYIYRRPAYLAKHVGDGLYLTTKDARNKVPLHEAGLYDSRAPRLR